MPLPVAALLQLARWNTPTVCNGWEQITAHDPAADGFNLDETRDYMPQMGPMAGYAVTVVIEPSSSAHKTNASAWEDYRRYVAGVAGPKIVVVQDLDKPRTIGSFWGEVNASIHRALGCVGTITDGAIRDVDEMTAAGFKAIARRLCVSHAHVVPVRWDVPVTVFGREVRPGQLVHADKHGFLAVPPEDEERLLAAAAFMDANECRTLIEAARGTSGMASEAILAGIDAAAKRFREAAEREFCRPGEW